MKSRTRSERYNFLFLTCSRLASRIRLKLEERTRETRDRVSRVQAKIGWIGSSLTRVENGIGSRR